MKLTANMARAITKKNDKVIYSVLDKIRIENDKGNNFAKIYGVSTSSVDILNEMGFKTKLKSVMTLFVVDIEWESGFHIPTDEDLEEYRKSLKVDNYFFDIFKAAKDGYKCCDIVATQHTINKLKKDGFGISGTHTPNLYNVFW